MYGGPRPGSAGLQGRGLPVPAQVHRRPGHARGARRPARAADQPGAGRARRRHGRLRQPDRAPLPRRPGAPRGGRHAGHHRVDPRRPGLPAQGGGRASTSIRAHEEHFLRAGGRGLAGRARPSRSSATSTPSGCRSSRSSCARPRAATCTTTSSWRCSTTCSASSRAAAARAPARTGTGCSGIDLERSHEFEREISRGCEGIKPGLGAGQLQLLHLRARSSDYIVEAVRLVAREGWRLLPDYRFDPATGRWRHRDGSGRAAAAAEPGRLRRGRRDDLPARQDRAPESELDRLPRRGGGPARRVRRCAGRPTPTRQRAVGGLRAPAAGSTCPSACLARHVSTAHSTADDGLVDGLVDGQVRTLEPDPASLQRPDAGQRHEARVQPRDLGEDALRASHHPSGA